MTGLKPYSVEIGKQGGAVVKFAYFGYRLDAARYNSKTPAYEHAKAMNDWFAGLSDDQKASWWPRRRTEKEEL